MKPRLVWPSGIVVGLVVVFAIACSGPGMDALGDAMVDVGTAIGDAGGSMIADAEATDGSATDDAPLTDVSVSIDSGPRPPLAIMANCDQVYTRTITTPTAVMVQTEWRAEVDAAVTTTGAIPRFWVRQCEVDRESFGSPPGACPSGATCTGTAAPPAACYVTGGGSIDEGRIVVSCGFRFQTDYVSTTLPDSDSGQRYTRIEIEIE